MSTVDLALSGLAVLISVGNTLAITVFRGGFRGPRGYIGEAGSPGPEGVPGPKGDPGFGWGV